jgi:hypothetical protein
MLTCLHPFIFKYDKFLQFFKEDSSASLIEGIPESSNCFKFKQFSTKHHRTC